MTKTRNFSTAALAAMLLITFAGADGSGARAQVSAAPAQTTGNDARLTEEVVPRFVSEEVVQPLPNAGEPAKSDDGNRPASLRAMVAQTAVGEPLSEEMHCLAGAVFFESRGEPLEGQLAVAQVIINRAASGQFPADYCGVVFQRAQFSFVKGGRMPAIATGTQAWRNAQAIAHIAHRGLWDSAADDSLYFHANYVRPSWSRHKVARATIDTHIFYR